MYEERKTDEVRRLAAGIYETSHADLLRIARRNAASAADAEDAVQEAFACFLRDYDPDSGAAPLAWLTLVAKRRCWRLRDAAHLERRIGPDPEGEHEEPTALIERVPGESRPVAERLADRDEARHHLRRLKPDQRTALGMLAAGCTYEEVGRARGWTHTKVNRCIYEGRRALRGGVAR